MTKVIEAILEDGVLIPLKPLDLPEGHRVRLEIEVIEGKPITEREEALLELFKGIRSMNFRSDGSYPTRDELHER